MASSSTSSIHKTYQFDVFLSFRGEDTRKNFVDHLYKALHQQGIRTFKDDERLEKGKRINDELLISIDDSKFCIIVFSKNYASSSWCLDELVKIMEFHKDTAYPVFYNVDPSEVRKQKGAVKKAFSRHANKEEAGKWREAMREAANLSGWDVRKTAYGHESKVIDLIVHRISLELRSLNVDIDESLVGMQQRMRVLDSCLKIGNSDDVRMIGIKGMGGAGKTTLARAIFDRFSIHFEAKSFVEIVREASKPTSGLLSLQRQVISDLLKDHGQVSSVHDAKRMMKMRLCIKKFLLVLDDVDKTEQLEALAGSPNWFKAGSRIIITTRDEQVLIAHKVNFIRDVALLSNEEAIRLFSRHAFGREEPRSEYYTQSLEVVRYAAGLPLMIKVLGSSLCGKNKPEWTDALKRLRTIPLKETLEKLELSYESLENDYKEIFLDVTCFMRGWNKEYAISALEMCGFQARNGLKVLEQRSLITNGRDFVDFVIIDMHDHIEELGKNIVRRLHQDEPHEHSRLWIQEEIEDILANDMGTEVTRCLRLEHTPEIALKGLGNMKKLRYLQVKSYGYDGFNAQVPIDDEFLPKSLRYLYWRFYPFGCLPKTFCANNLVALEIPFGKIEYLWPHGEIKVMKKLTYLNLRFSKIRKLDLGLTPNLERLDLSVCEDLEEVHVPVGCLKKLVYLNLSSCKRLKSLSFIKPLESLEILILRNLSLTEFPDIIPGHCNSTLLELDFSMNDIKELPSSIGNLHKLVSLDMSCCRKLKTQLPNSICMLKNLKILRLFGCSALEHLPEDVGRLESLEELNLSYSNIRYIPTSVGTLKRMRVLKLRDCTRLVKGTRRFAMFSNFGYSGYRRYISHLPRNFSLLKGLEIRGFEAEDEVSSDDSGFIPEDESSIDDSDAILEDPLKKIRILSNFWGVGIYTP